MGIRRDTIGSVTVLSLSGGFFGGDETDALQKAIVDEDAAGNMRLVLDMSDCSLMNSSALSVMFQAYKSYRARNAEIKLCGLHKKRFSPATKLNIVFATYLSVEEAVASFVGSATSHQG